jgi:hypothetical protein
MSIQKIADPCSRRRCWEGSPSRACSPAAAGAAGRPRAHAPDAAPQMFRHLAKQLDLTADQQSQIRAS